MLAVAFTSDEHIEAPRPANANPRKPSGLLSQLTGGTPRVVDAKDHVFREGDPATSVYRVESGHVCLYRLMPDGRRQVMDFAYPGDFIGLGALGHHAASAQATEKTRLCAFAVATFREIARNQPSLSLNLYEAVSQELQATREMLMNVCQRTALERVASFLLELSRRNERRGEAAHDIVLPMTRTDIADFLGLTIETVSRTFTKLRQDGVIDLEQCILVSIRDPQKLEGLSGGRVERNA